MKINLLIKIVDKYNMIWLGNISGIKIFFILLAKILAFYKTSYKRGLEIILSAGFLIIFSNDYPILRGKNLYKTLLFLIYLLWSILQV